MLENNNGSVTPRFFQDDKNLLHLKSIRSSPFFKQNIIPICKEEKPTFIAYKPKSKKVFSCYELINNKKENLQFITDVSTNYKFMENFKNKGLIDAAFKIDKYRHLNSSQTTDNFRGTNNNNLQKFYQTVSDFKSKNLIPPVTAQGFYISLVNNKEENIMSKKIFSHTQNNFLPKNSRMYNKKNFEKKQNLLHNFHLNSRGSKKTYSSQIKMKEINNSRKSVEKNIENKDNIDFSDSNMTISDNSMHFIHKMKKKTKKNNKEKQYNYDRCGLIHPSSLLHDVELKLADTETENYVLPLEIDETETKFFKRYLNYIEYIKKKRLNSPEKADKINNSNNNNYSSLNILNSNNTNNILLSNSNNNYNNGNYKEFHHSKNFNKIDISPFDIDIVEFREKIAKSAEILMNSLKEKRMNRMFDLGKAKNKIFKEVVQNNTFENILDKVFRKVIYVSDKNVEICEDYVVNLIHFEIGQLTIRNTSIPSDTAHTKNSYNNPATNNNPNTNGNHSEYGNTLINLLNLPPLGKKGGTDSSSNSQYGLSENVFKIPCEQKSKSRLDLKGALSPIGEIELDTESKFKILNETITKSNNKDQDKKNKSQKKKEGKNLSNINL